MFPGHDATQPVELQDRLIAAFNQGTPKITPRERAHLISQYDGAIAYDDVEVGRVIDKLRERGVYDRTLIIVLSDHGECFGEHDVITHGLANYDPETHVPLIVKSPGQTKGGVDPGETHNLAPSADSQRMAAEIAAWRRSPRSINAAAPARAIDPEMLRRLRALGYVQ